MKTNDEMIASLPTEEQEEIKAMVEKELIKWGGKRAGAGRPKKENVLKFQIRVSQEEKDFLKYARSHNFNYSELMQG